jgi:HK97 family phage major capsid protein
MATKYTPETRQWFRAMVNNDEMELRTMVAGTQSITYTQGAAGGYLVPNEFYDALVLGLAQVDPLLDENVVTLVTKNGARPLTIPAWDLSSYEAEEIGEGSGQSEQSVPTASNALIGGKSYRCRLQASYEFEDDDFQPVIDQFAKALAIGFARKVGSALVSSLLAGAANSFYTTAAANAISADDIQEIYFSLNPVYRNSPKCAFVMSDATYKLVRKAKDNNNRPLINVVDDKEMLMGKPVVIAPSMPSHNPSISGAKGIVFGDLSHFIVRTSVPTMRRSIETSVGADWGQAIFTSIMRAEGKVVDPSGNAIQYSTLHD